MPKYIAFNAMSTAATPEHELQTFFQQDRDELASEYERIRRRTIEDPGTAGDEGEGNWAKLLREWLPGSHTIVTKGRLLSVDGILSPQIDVVVLNPGYPQRLLNKKVHLASGVAAAFECKNTLESSHLTKAAQTAAFVRQLAGRRSGSPYRELFSPPIYGVLAHSHVWKKPRSRPARTSRGSLLSCMRQRHILAIS
jgi:uncharacterized protein DUF6602